MFGISSADGSELWLSTDDDPQNSRKIAYLGDVRPNKYGTIPSLKGRWILIFTVTDFSKGMTVLTSYRI